MNIAKKARQSSNLNQFAGEVLKKSPSKFDLYSQSDKYQKELENLVPIFTEMYKKFNKEELIYQLANSELEIKFHKNISSQGGKAKHEKYQKYFEIVQKVYADLLGKKETFEEIIPLKELNKALDKEYPNIHWCNNRVEGLKTKEKDVDGKPVVKLAQIYRTISRDHRLFLIVESASIHT